MPSKSGFFLAACMATLATAQESPKPQLTARELFYAPVDAAPKSAPAKAAATKTQAKAPATKAAPVATASAETKPAAAPAASVASRQERTEVADGARIVPVAANVTTAPAGPPLGLKYTILKKSGSDMVEVPGDTVFHAGDRIEVRVQTNLPGYLYIVTQGSSGTWKPLFPSPEVEDGNNHVEGFHDYNLPPKARFVFDEQAGNEKLFLVLSRQPEPSLEKMIYSLQGGTAPVSAPKPAEPAKGKTLLVLANPKIDDATVGFLRTAYARDLIIEKVTDATPGEKKETAVYVVNPTGSSDSRVVADLQLVHK